jgi:lysozyme family protein
MPNSILIVEAFMGFDTAVKIILEMEGGYVNNPRDPGGETNYGISKRSYPTLDIRNLDRSQAEAIYRNDYWNKMQCDKMPDGVALIVFDMAVNQGPGIAAQLLQKAIGCKADGVVGPNTISCICAQPATAIIDDVRRKREAHYRSTINFDTFGAGWMNRLEHIYKLAREMTNE